MRATKCGFYFLICSLLWLAPLYLEAGNLTLETKTVATASGDSLSVDAGWLTLPENRASESGRTVAIPFYRLKSLAPNPGPAIFILTGGPGSSGIEQFAQFQVSNMIRFFQEFTDVVVFDQRGAGSSRPNLLPSDRQPGLGIETPADRDHLQKVFQENAQNSRAYCHAQGIDLTAFNTDENAKDVDALRAALGYKKIILIGGSYGSHLGLHLVRTFPKHIDRAIFYGIEGPDHTYDLPGHVLNAYQRISTFVEETQVYQKRLPKGGLLEAWRQTIQRLTANPIKTNVTIKGKTVDVWVTAALVQLAGSKGAGSHSHPEKWPEIILAMYEGDYRLPARIALSLQSLSPMNPMKYMMDLASGASATRQRAIEADPAQEILGFLNFDYAATAETWQAPDLGNGFRENLVTDTPVLLIHGTWDTSTPIENAREVLTGLKQGHLIEVVRGGHGALFNLLSRWPPAQDTLRKFLLGQEVTLPDQVTLSAPMFPQQAKAGSPQIQLWEACRVGDIAAIRKAIQLGANVNLLDTRKSSSGRRPLNWAALADHPAALKILLEAGADINLANLTGFTALHHAAENNSVACAEFLMGAGANPHLKTVKDMTPLQIAEKFQHQAVVNLLHSK